MQWNSWTDQAQGSLQGQARLTYPWGQGRDEHPSTIGRDIQTGSDSLPRVSCVDTVRESISPPIVWTGLDWSRLSLTNGALNLGILTRFTFILATNEALSKGLDLRIVLRKAALLQDLHGFFHASNSFATLEDFIPCSCWDNSPRKGHDTP
jgi:hypothetical protein